MQEHNLLSGLVGTISTPQIPELERGIGLAKKGHQYLLEGNGNEAVVPLDKNKYWTGKVASEIKSQLLNENDNMNLKDVFKSLCSNIGNEINSGLKGNVPNNITVQFYPQQMNDTELEKAFNYIDKRYGMQYSI